MPRARIAAALVLTSPFIPMLFQGEEFGASAPFQYFADFSEDPDLTKAVSEGRRKEFGSLGWKAEEMPEPGSSETFERSRIDWKERDQEPHRSLLDWHIQLIELRRRYPQFTDGRLYLVVTEFNEEQQWLSIERGLISILVNLANEPRKIPLRDGRPTNLLLSSVDEGIAISKEEAVLPANSIVFLGPILETRGQTLFRNVVEVLSI
jgi:maltooligosyltrehalose trehalohydrolase